MSGASGQRWSLSTAKPRTFFASISERRLPMPKIAIGAVPVIIALIASPPPLNGTRTKSTPCFLLNSSMKATLEIEGAM